MIKKNLLLFITICYFVQYSFCKTVQGQEYRAKPEINKESSSFEDRKLMMINEVADWEKDLDKSSFKLTDD